MEHHVQQMAVAEGVGLLEVVVGLGSLEVVAVVTKVVQQVLGMVGVSPLLWHRHLKGVRSSSVVYTELESTVKS